MLPFKDFKRQKSMLSDAGYRCSLQGNLTLLGLCGSCASKPPASTVQRRYSFMDVKTYKVSSHHLKNFCGSLAVCSLGVCSCS